MNLKYKYYKPFLRLREKTFYNFYHGEEGGGACHCRQILVMFEKNKGFFMFNKDII